MGTFFELLRKLAGATADALAGFLLGNDIPKSLSDDDGTHGRYQDSSAKPAANAPVKTPETVKNSPLDSFGQGLAESFEGFGAGHHHEPDARFMPETPGPEEGMHHSR